MSLQTIRVVFDSVDQEAIRNIQMQVVALINSAVSSVSVKAATYSPVGGPIVDLIDLAEAHRNAQAATETQDQATQTQSPPQDVTAASALPTGKEF